MFCWGCDCYITHACACRQQPSKLFFSSAWSSSYKYLAAPSACSWFPRWRDSGRRRLTVDLDFSRETCCGTRVLLAWNSVWWGLKVLFALFAVNLISLFHNYTHPKCTKFEFASCVMDCNEMAFRNAVCVMLRLVSYVVLVCIALKLFNFLAINLCHRL